MGGGRGWACIKPALRQARPRGGLFQKMRKGLQLLCRKLHSDVLVHGLLLSKNGKALAVQVGKGFQISHGLVGGFFPAGGRIFFLLVRLLGRVHRI